MNGYKIALITLLCVAIMLHVATTPAQVKNDRITPWLAFAGFLIWAVALFLAVMA